MAGHDFNNGVELLGLDGWQWHQAPIPNPEMNYCTNANKATGEDQDCSDAGNSAWNTHTSAATYSPLHAQDLPYPDHNHSIYAVKGEKYVVPAPKGDGDAKPAEGEAKEKTEEKKEKKAE